MRNYPLKTFLLFTLLFGATCLQAQIEEEEIYSIVEEMPTFPDCDTLAIEKNKKKCTTDQLLKYLSQHIVYPDTAKIHRIEGLVVVQFIIGKDGKVHNPKIIKDIGGGCGNEALRVINKMNTDGIIWTPGRQDGRKVLVRYVLPLRFKLSGY